MKLKALKTGLLIVAVLGTFVILGLSGSYQEDKPCTALNIDMKNDRQNFFLTRDDVKEIVRDEIGGPAVGIPLREIQVASIEGTLESNPYVQHAEVWKDLAGQLNIEIGLRRPTARVMNENGGGFYLDHNFEKVPLSNSFSANVLLIRGPFHEDIEPRDSIADPLLAGIKDFLDTVDDDRLFRAMISEVQIKPNGEMVLHPELGNIPVEFGDADRTEEKLDDLRKFYKEVLNKAGWNRYSGVSVKYRNQVVAIN